MGKCGRGSPPPAVGVQAYQPVIFFEHSDAKSCILVASALISGLPRTCISEQTTSMSKSWATNTLLVPQPKKLGMGTSLPRSPRLLRLCPFLFPLPFYFHPLFLKSSYRSRHSAVINGAVIKLPSGIQGRAPAANTFRCISWS